MRTIFILHGKLFSGMVGRPALVLLLSSSSLFRVSPKSAPSPYFDRLQQSLKLPHIQPSSVLPWMAAQTCSTLFLGTSSSHSTQIPSCSRNNSVNSERDEGGVIKLRIHLMVLHSTCTHGIEGPGDGKWKERKRCVSSLSSSYPLRLE